MGAGEGWWSRQRPWGSCRFHRSPGAGSAIQFLLPFSRCYFFISVLGAYVSGLFPHLLWQEPRNPGPGDLRPLSESSPPALSLPRRPLRLRAGGPALRYGGTSAFTGMLGGRAGTGSSAWDPQQGEGGARLTDPLLESGSSFLPLLPRPKLRAQQEGRQRARLGRSAKEA